MFYIKKCVFYIIILDIDFFKSINDNFGHDKGDDVLIKSTKVILTNIKKDDLFCRVGGEEFVIVSENINTKDELEKFANKIRTSVENFDFEFLILYLQSFLKRGNG